MTKISLNITREDGPLWFDARGHADNREVCGMVSSILNFLTVYMSEQGFTPTIYESGHLQFDIYMSNIHINKVFRAAALTLEALENQYPENLKVYA